MLTPAPQISELGKPSLAIDLASAAASQNTENRLMQELGNNSRQSYDVAIKKESAHGFSSENSHVNTRSAVDKGNFEQKCTDQSEGRANQDESG